MKPKLKKILDNLHRYNQEHMAERTFGLSESVVYDALVYAPSYTPYKLKMDGRFKMTELPAAGYCASWLVEKDDLKIAWVRTATCASNLLDYLLLCAELKFRKLIFLGSAGALKPGLELGDVCTPVYSIAGTMANAYLKDCLKDYVLFEKVEPDAEYVNSVIELAKEKGFDLKKASVFCTDSIVMEYTHLEEIRSFETDLIEMETATLYEVGKLMEVPTVALLVVSDNSATGVPLIGRTEEQQSKYHHARTTVLPDMIEQIAKAKEK